MVTVEFTTPLNARGGLNEDRAKGHQGGDVSLPTKEELIKLGQHEAYGDDEAYHWSFDSILEDKLMALDPEWMTAMTTIYKKSGMSRWCA